MNINNNKFNHIYNKINILEQYNKITHKKENYLFKIKTNFYLKNSDKNRFLFITNLLLLERSCGQRVVFVKNREEAPRVKPFKIGCSVSIRYEYLFNFWKMLVFYSFPKLYDIINAKNNKYNVRFKELGKTKKEKGDNITHLNFNRFLFMSAFSFSNDFDRFLLNYEDFSYYLSVELYSGFHKFFLNNSVLTSNGLHII